VPADVASPLADPAARAPMRVVARDARSVTFEGSVGGAKVTKSFALTGRPYEIAVELRAEGAPGALGVLYPAYVSPDAPRPGFFSGGEVVETVVPVCRADAKTVRMKGEETQRLDGAVRWAGLDQHYFVSALMPESAATCAFLKGGRGELATLVRLPYDRGLDVKAKLFAGPKQLDLLQAYGRELDTAIDYGAVTNLFSFFARMLLWVLRQAYAIVHNWGVAIILLTLLVKVVLYPLTAKSMQSMNEMRKLQPEIEKLKAKFGDDREKMNVAVMQLYQQHKVNPLGGCLPLLLQMPVFFALYATLQTSVELYREPFLWISDLTRYDPLYILPLAMGASQFVMQKLSPQPADNAQAKMMLYFMPVFFTFIMFKLPAGLALYIFANNLISMAQQQWLMRRSQASAPAAAA
jgi:YidC/Oxa1 family membrane protein insertase